MLRSPLLVTWKCVRARSAKVHACGAQLKARISRNFGEGRESAVEIPRKKNSLTAALAANFERVRTTAEREKNKIGRAAASVHDEWKKGTKIMKKIKTESNRSQKALQDRKVRGNSGVDTAANGPQKALTPTWRTPA